MGGLRCILRTQTFVRQTALTLIVGGAAQADTLTIANRQNGDYDPMQAYGRLLPPRPSHGWWVTLKKNVLRKRVTTDITHQRWQFEYHDNRHVKMRRPIWGCQWLALSPLTILSPSE